jgi:hypothetical protein
MISKETENWLQGLKAEGKLSDEVIAQLRSAAESNVETDNFFKGSVLRQSEFSRNMGEVQKAQTELEKAQADLRIRTDEAAKFREDVVNWKTGAEENYKKALADSEAAARKEAAAVARLKNLAMANGLPVDEVLKELDFVENKVVDPPQFDTSKFVTKDDISQANQGHALVNALIYDLGERHRDLFGTRLPNAKELVAEAIKAGRPLEDYWKEKFKVPEKEKEIYENSVKAKFEEEFKNKEISLRSSLQIPQERAGNQSQHPLFSNPGLKELAAKVTHNDTSNSGEGVSAAIAAFNEGKYNTRR